MESKEEFSIEKVHIVAGQRSLKAEYTFETKEDLRVLCGPFYEEFIPVDGPISKHLKKYLNTTRWNECKCWCKWHNNPFPKRYSRKQRKLLKQWMRRVTNERTRQEHLEFAKILADEIQKEINTEILRDIYKTTE